MPNRTAALAYLVGSDVPHSPAINVSPDGQVTRRAEAFPIRFAFSFMNIPIQAEVSDGAHELRLVLTATLGTLPYSIENGGKRERIMRVMDALAYERVVSEITRRQRICLYAATDIDVTATSSDMLSAAIVALLPLRGWIELLKSVIEGPAVV